MIYEATDYWNSSYISHHGVKGMKWGVRKAAAVGAGVYLAKRHPLLAAVGAGTYAARKKNIGKKVSDYSAKRKQRRYERSDYAKAKTMSNQELQQAINRINLEQSYISAVERDRSAYKEATSNILMKTGRRTMRSIYDKFLNVGVSAVNIGGQLTKNAVVNSANKAFPITKKPKK